MPTVTTNGTYVAKTVAHNASNVSIKFLAQGWCIDSDNYARPFPYLTNAGLQVKCSIGETHIQLVSGIVAFSGKTCYVTMRYTKSTD